MPLRKWGYFSSLPRAFLIIKYNISRLILHLNLYKVLHLLWKKITIPVTNGDIEPSPNIYIMENDIGTSKSDKGPAPNILPATESYTGTSPRITLATKVTLKPYQVLHLLRKVTLCNLNRMSGARGLPLQHQHENDRTKLQRRSPQKGETYIVTWLYCNFLNRDLILMWFNWCVTLLNCDLIELWLYLRSGLTRMRKNPLASRSSSLITENYKTVQISAYFSVIFPTKCLYCF